MSISFRTKFECMQDSMMRGSSSSVSLDEVEALLLQQQRNRNLILEREKLLNINRSGSAPPTVEGALGAAGSLFNYHNSIQLDFSCSSNNTNGFGTLTEEEIRSHPSYLEYYYSHENLNPRLPPPLLSKEDWRVAQRVKSGGFGLDKKVVYNSGSSSFFSMQKDLSVNRAEDELVGLRKAALRNLSRKNSAELMEKVSSGLPGASSSGMGVRRKSFADILQEGISQPVKSHLTVSASQNSVTDVLSSTGISQRHEMGVQNKSEAFKYMVPENALRNLHNTQNIVSAKCSTLSSCMSSSSSSTNPRTKLVGRPPSPSLANLGQVHHANSLNFVELDAPNATSSSIFEIADIAASLSGLNMSGGQLRSDYLLSSSSLVTGGISMGHKQNQTQCYIDNSREDDMIHNMNYAHVGRRHGPARCQDVPKSVLNDRVGFPRRTSSTSELQSLHSPDFSGLEDLKAQCRSSIRPAANISSSKNVGYLVDHKPDMMAHSDLNQGSHQMQYMQQVLNHGRDSYEISRNSCQGNHFVGNLHPHEDLQALEKAYLEALLIQQAHQYQSHLLQKNDSINHHYHGNLAFGPSAASYQRNLMPTFGVSSRIPMLHNENVQVPPNMRSIMGDSTGSLHSHNRNYVKGRPETLLQVFKNDKTKTLELPDILGHVVEFSMDQIGSRFIQEKLETATADEKMKILGEIIPHAHGLTIDVFGNYVIQKFFEHGTESQRKELVKHIISHVLPLSLHMYGCRVVQKALEVVDPELQVEIAKQLDGSVMKCVHDQNGNHVIQKCIECIPQDRIQFIISSFLGQVVNFSTHPYGCRVIQRVLEHCDDPKIQEVIMDEIMNSVCKLAQDQYGNYVIQHVVQHGKPNERSAIISKLAGQIVKMSQQKFASNVVEKCLIFGMPEERQLLVNEMFGQTDENEPLQAMMKDPFGNYVVQKMLETCDDKSRELILSRVKIHLSVLKRYTYGKHIVSRVEKLIAAGERQREQSSSNSS